MSKRIVRYFVSYAHADEPLPEKLITELQKQLGACKDYDFRPWRDTGLLIGEKWHDEIQQAIRDCDFGLLLVSPAFLGSKYIGEHELPDFVNGKKPCLPVALCKMDFKHQDLRGLKDSQIFRFQSGAGKTLRTFADCSGKLVGDFAHELFRQITERLGKVFAGRVAGGGVAALSTSIPHNLPTLQPFFGREDELRKIADALDPDSRTWGALIDGPGGMGKTSLAVRAAYDAPPDVFKKIIFVSLKTRELDDDGVRDLSGFILSGLVELLNELARELDCDDIAKAPEDQRPRLLLDKLRGTQTLLVLDNLESLIKRDRDTLFTFVKKLPAGCKAIFTSRERFGNGTEELTLEALSEEAALATLAELATHNPLLAQTSEAERLVLYRETAGKPLLLRWTAGQLGRGHCLTFTDALHFIRSCPEGNDPLKFIFGDLVEDFDAAETQALCALTYFTLPVEVKHVAVIAGLPEPDTDRALRKLTVRSLAVPTDELKTFTLVPMVADFLRKKKPEVVAETGDRLEKRAYTLIMENGWKKHDRFPALETAWPGIAPALALFLAGDNARLQTVCAALQHFLGFQGRWDEGLALNEKAEARAVAAADRDNAGWRAFDAGYIHSLRQQADAVITCADRAAEHWHRAKASAREHAHAIGLSGLGLRLKMNFPAAIAAYRNAMDLLRGLAAESEDMGLALNLLADTERRFGEFDAAEEHFSEALRVTRAVGQVEGWPPPSPIWLCWPSTAKTGRSQRPWRARPCR